MLKYFCFCSNMNVIELIDMAISAMTANPGQANPLPTENHVR